MRLSSRTGRNRCPRNSPQRKKRFYLKAQQTRRLKPQLKQSRKNRLVTKSQFRQR